MKQNMTQKAGFSALGCSCWILQIEIVKKKLNILTETALNHHAAGVCPALVTDILLFIRDVYMRGTPYTNKAAQHDFMRNRNTSPWEEDGYLRQIIKSFAYVRIFLFVFLRADH